jgi:bacillithiol biosynthesis deacetylase BshB1
LENKRVKLDVLAIAAHPDDTEITCGGLLIKMAKMGRKTGVLDLTKGESGTFGDENIRMSEAAAASKVMGLAFRDFLGLPDSAIEYNQENKLKVAQVIRNTAPELIILPHWEQRHPDHLAASKLGYDACFLAGLKRLNLKGEPVRPRKIIYVTYFRNQDVSFLVDISDEFEQKCEAVKCYHSQFGDPKNSLMVFHPGESVFDIMQIRGARFGQMAGVKYAEGYTIKETFLIDDPQKMPVRSI